MDALDFLKFWKHNPTTSSAKTSPNPLTRTKNDVEEDEDSFFDIEINLPDSDKKGDNKNSQDGTTMANLLDLCQEMDNSLAINTGCLTKLSFSSPSSDPISKRKILPVEPNFKPQSTIFKSSTRLTLFFHNRLPSRAHKTEETEYPSISMATQKTRDRKNKPLKFKLKIEESQTPQVLTRNTSMRSTDIKTHSHKLEDSKTERFSKELLQKYLKFINPFYAKVYKTKISDELSVASPTSSPSMVSVSSPRTGKYGKLPMGISVLKHLGKSKSASMVVGVSSPVIRRDDYLLQQNDGIQSAILHCKRSFNSSKDCSLSRFASESSVDSVRSSFEEGN